MQKHIKNDVQGMVFWKKCLSLYAKTTNRKQLET